MANRKIRPIRLEGNIAYVPLTQGYTAVIDAADVPLVSGTNWTARISRRKNGTVYTVYAVRAKTDEGKQRTVIMHRVIAGTPNGLDTDHADGDGLNNRRANLRNATKSQNQSNQRLSSANRSGAKGVTWHSASGRWQAGIRSDGKISFLGYFNCVTAAAFAYAKASAALHKEFGRIA